MIGAPAIDQQWNDDSFWCTLCHMETTSRLKWLLWLLAVGFAASAALSYCGYVGNGIAAGSLIGLPGREGDVAKAQQYAGLWLGAAVMFQAGVVLDLYFLLGFSADAIRPSHFMVRALVAVLISFPFTLLVTAIMAAGMRFF